ncbi:hypothetical protein ACLIBG_06635 [Virgibacillus sp. W0181]|uniref:hypothetical protein n=1 Tax=Virgibacillus sp. W0181 TaxID=3391581 RepID=UPI003F44F15A
MTFLFIILSMILLPIDNGDYTLTSSDNSIQSKVIETYEEDVTGDGIKETIELKGTLLSENNPYYRQIWIDVITPQAKKWKISFGGGYEPTLQFVDLNHDGHNDVYYQSAAGGSGGLYHYYAYTLKNEKVNKINLPKDQFIKGEFATNYKINLQINSDQHPISIDVKERATNYERLNIYDADGKLLKNKKIMIDPIAFFEPKRISDTKGFGLKGYRQISGAYHADRIGTVETLWYYENDKWIILKNEWIPSNS